MRGRKPTPTSLHDLRGTYRPNRHGKRHEPEAVGDLMDEPPDWMDDIQQDSWRYAMTNAPQGVLKKIDRSLLAAWVVAETQHRTAAQMQTKMDQGQEWPLLVVKEFELVPSPYVKIMNLTALRMAKLGSEMGFSPASRPRITVAPTNKQGAPDEDSDNPWERLRVIRGGRG